MCVCVHVYMCVTLGSWIPIADLQRKRPPRCPKVSCVATHILKLQNVTAGGWTEWRGVFQIGVHSWM